MLRLAISADDLRTWAPVASAGFAFLAAAASWVSIRLTRRQWLAAQRPYLVPQLVKDAHGVVRLEIRNTGVGGAYGVRFCVVVDDQYVAGYAGPNLGGYLATDETAVVETGFQPRDEVGANGIVAYWDTVDRIHVRKLDASGPHLLRGRRRRRKDPTEPEEAFRQCYGWRASEGRERVAGVGKHKLPSGASRRSD